MTEIRLDEHELPRSHSSRRTYEDARCYVTLGGSAVHNDHRQIATVELKLFDLQILGGQSFREHLQSQKSDYYHATWQYLMQTLSPVGFSAIIENCWAEAEERYRNEGRAQKAKEIREALELD